MGRKQAREGAMKLLFQMESNEDFSFDAIELFLENFTYDEMETEYIRSAIHSIIENMPVIDKYIENHLQGWSLQRIAKVDKSILRIAVYEILYRKDIPTEVSINEAIENSKKYSSVDSFKFINGVLGEFVRALDKNE